MDTGNYRNRVLNPLVARLGLPKLNFQVLRLSMATQGAEHGFGEGHPGAPAACEGRYNGQRVHVGVAGAREEGRVGVLDADEKRGNAASENFATKCCQGLGMGGYN